MADQQTVTRTVFVLVLLVLASLGVVFVQQGQIREMRAIDCAASAERRERVGLYDELVKFWSSQSAPGSSEVAAAYRRQRESVARAADSSSGVCD